MWIVTSKFSSEVKAFNLTEEGDLWITRADNKGFKIAEGKEAFELYIEMCDMVTKSAPCLSEGRNGVWMKNIE